MENLVYFLASPRGRFARIVIGLLMLWFGAYVFAQPLGYWVMGIGVIPIVAGALNICLMAPLVQEPVRGSHLS